MKDLLKKYQNNELNAADTEGVEKRLVEQAVERELRQKWNALLKKQGIDRSATPVSSAANDAIQPTKMTAQRSTMRRFIMGIAATLLLAVGFWWWNVDTKTALDLTDIALKNERFAAPSVRMQPQNDDLKNWADAKNAYRDGAFDKAVTLIEAIPTPTVEQQFYMSLSYLYASKPDYAQAALGFKNIIENGQGNFEAESQWFYALSCIKLGQNDAAKQSLQTLLRGQTWKSKEAQALLDKIK